MDRCFNFLLNVDQCLNMSNFDMFFYKLEGQHLFHLNTVQFMEEDPSLSLAAAARDIRMYLNKFPFQVTNYRIVAAMRARALRQGEEQLWEYSMLYRLLKIYYALEDARIFIDSKEQTDRALHLIMLYDADMTVEVRERSAYHPEMDIPVLRKVLGLSDGPYTDDEAFIRHLKDWRGLNGGRYPVLSRMIGEFLRFFEGGIGEARAVLNADSVHGETLGEEGVGEDCFPILMEEIKKKIERYLVSEVNIDRNNREENLLMLHRVVDYLNLDPREMAPADAQSGTVPLMQRCRLAWRQTMADTDIERRYAKRLLAFENRLLAKQNDLEQPFYDRNEDSNLPDYMPPADDEIEGDTALLATQNREQARHMLKALLDGFMVRSIRPSQLEAGWKATYKALKDSVSRMDLELAAYANDLSRRYASEIEERKVHFRRLSTRSYRADRHTEQKILDLTHSKEELLTALKSPKMNPSLKFQDRLNFENALEQTNLDIKFYISCMQKISAALFLAFLAGSGGAVLLHYLLLQPNNLLHPEMLVTALIYTGCVFLLMLFAWMAPYRYFRRKMAASIKSLREAMELFISGYFQKAENFKAYINALNALDDVSRYLKLFSETSDQSQLKAKKHLWNKVQIRRHLEKLDFFRGMFEAYSFADDEITVSGAGERMEEDLTRNPLYWP